MIVLSGKSSAYVNISREDSAVKGGAVLSRRAALEKTVPASELPVLADIVRSDIVVVVPQVHPLRQALVIGRIKGLRKWRARGDESGHWSETLSLITHSNVFTL